MSRVNDLIVGSIAGDHRKRRGRYFLHKEPIGLRLAHDALKFRDQVFVPWLKAIGAHNMNQLRKWLAGRPANNAVEPMRRRPEPLYVPAPQHVRAAHDAKSRFLE